MTNSHAWDQIWAATKASARSILALAGLVALQGCGDAELEPWHTQTLTKEFTADRADEVRTLEDYMRLEDELFRELDEKIYARVNPTPENHLSRFSPGSAADPRGHNPDWNRSFELPVETAKGGVLLLHGLTDAPYSLRILGKALQARGYWVLGLRMPGHGTAPSGLRTVTWRDMAAATHLGVRHLAAQVGGKPLHIVGYSTGAALALDFALEVYEGNAGPLPASLVLVSPAVSVHPAAALAGLKDGLAWLPGLGGLAWMQVVPEFDPYKYNSFATNAGAQVHELTRSVTRRLREGSRDYSDFPAILVFKSTVDATVSTDAVVDNLLRQVDTKRHELVLFDINRLAVKSTLMVSDPAPLTDRLMGEDDLPFAVTFVTNQSAESAAVVARRKPAFSSDLTEDVPLDLSWPDGVLSLSHVALPFPPEDPLYGRRAPDNKDALFLGQMAIKGERGLLQFPPDWLLRLRHNPFYDYLEARTLDWVEQADSAAAQ